MENNKTAKKSLFENPLLSSKVKSANVKLPEIFFGYLLGPIGGLLISGILGAQIITYWQQVLFAAEFADPTAAIYKTVTTFTTLLPIISAIFIVAGNLIVGQLIEKTRTKAGKARPWILISSFCLCAASILMFVIPGSSNAMLKMVTQAIAYNLYYAVAYPMYNTANSTLIPVSTRNSKHRGLLASATNIAGLAVMGAGSMIFPALISLVLHYNSAAWMVAFIIIGIISFLLPVLQFYFTRERVTEETMNSSVTAQKIPIKKQLKAVATDKFWWLVIIFYLIFQFSGALKNASMYNYCYITLAGVGVDAGLMQTILGIVGALPMAIAVVVIWPLANKFNKKIVVAAGMLIGVAGGILAGLCYDSIVLASIGIALKCLGSAPACYMILAMIADVLDHIEAKHGYRCDGFTMSIYSSIMIAATPICAGIFSGLLGSVGFVSGATGQTAAVNNVIVASYIWVETAAYAVCMLLMLFFGVEKGLKKDQETILERQKAETLARGEEWIEPAERLRLEEEEQDRLAEAARIEESKARCAKKGLDFEKVEAEYQAKQAEKKAKAAAKAKKPAEPPAASDSVADPAETRSEQAEPHTDEESKPVEQASEETSSDEE